MEDKGTEIKRCLMVLEAVEAGIQGAFTYFLRKHVRDTKEKSTRSELLKRLRASLRYEGHEQAPQLEGAAEARKRPLFG